jgi:pyruvate dehydrogenase E2 component (dihydrolipoamide acetyltransferase)
MYQVDAFTAIIVSPQAAILAVGRIADRVVPVDGKPGIRPMLTLSLSCDHRVLDGARGALFLSDLAAAILEPQTLIQ